MAFSAAMARQNTASSSHKRQGLRHRIASIHSRSNSSNRARIASSHSLLSKERLLEWRGGFSLPTLRLFPALNSIPANLPSCSASGCPPPRSCLYILIWNVGCKLCCSDFMYTENAFSNLLLAEGQRLARHFKLMPMVSGVFNSRPYLHDACL